MPRPAFMGYVAISPSAGAGSGGEVDVAFVWRGTIFKEEWAANFGADQLVGGGWCGRWVCSTHARASMRSSLHAGGA